MNHIERIVTIQNLEAQKININEPMNQKEVEYLIRSFGNMKNINDGRIAEIPISTIGKIIKHKGYDISRIIFSIPILYKTSLLGWSEPEIYRKDHKHHPNIKEYHHYINKFSDGIMEYYIRFTLNEERVKKIKIGKNYIHSTFISRVTIYKNGDGSQRIRENCPGEVSTPPFYDSRLIDFLNSVK